jgi:hypothetical protein
MKYSLRSLMVGVTLVCVLFGGVGSVIGRVAYLKQRASYHAQKASACEQQLFADSYSSAGLLLESADTARRLAYHRRMHHEFTHAAGRPWTAVDESAP